MQPKPVQLHTCEKHFFPGTTETEPFLSITPRQASGRTLSERPMVPKIIILNKKDGHLGTLQRVNRRSRANLHAQNHFSTPVQAISVSFTSTETHCRREEETLRPFNEHIPDVRLVGFKNQPPSVKTPRFQAVPSTPDYMPPLNFGLLRRTTRSWRRFWKQGCFWNITWRMPSSVENISCSFAN